MSRIRLHKSSLCGLRPTNEDVEKYFLNMATDGSAIDDQYLPIDVFVICDGHGGKDVSIFVANKLMSLLTKKTNDFPLSKIEVNKIYDKIQDSLVDHKNNIAQKCGCTALVIIKYVKVNHYIQVINLGDCRAVICQKGLAIPLTLDHKPFWSNEKKRIDIVNKDHKTNKLIHFDQGDWRIGDLSVSRAFGDLDNTPYITHKPDIFVYKLKNTYEFILMACDGLFDVMENHEAINFIRDQRDKNHVEFYTFDNSIDNSKNIAKKLGIYALNKGSTDNVSIMIIFLEF